MRSRTIRWNALVAAAALAAGGAALAADPGKSAPPAPTPEQRKQMAEVHQRMAACLASDKPIAECRTEMWANCQSLMGKTGCPMMGGAGWMGPGMMGGGQGMGPGMMRGAPPPPKPPN